jgi:hypothetical protein
MEKRIKMKNLKKVSAKTALAFDYTINPDEDKWN